RLARAVDDSDLIVEVALCRGYGGETVEFANPERLELLNDALDRVGEDDSAARAQLLSALAEELDPIEYKHRRAYAEEALAVGRRGGAQRGDLELLRRMLPDILAPPDRLERRREDVAVGIDLATRFGHLTALFWLHRAGMLLEIEAADADA